MYNGWGLEYYICVAFSYCENYFLIVHRD